MREMVSGVIVILCLFIVVYVYAGYPLLVSLLARCWPNPVKRGPCPARCSILISSLNEADRLSNKISGLRDVRGYEQVEEVLVGLDGPADETATALAAVSEPKLRVTPFPVRRGKPSVLNDLVAVARGEILVFTDARQCLAPAAIAALLENFADPRVGVVSGELVFRASGVQTGAAAAIRSYWGYEKWIRRSESAFRSVPGATGALYAIRRSLFVPMPMQTLLDDVWVPLHVVKAGFRCVFESRAVAYDAPSASSQDEGRRKRRTLAGNLQLVALAPWLADPSRNPIWWEFWSHKIGRLIVPWALVGLLVSCLTGCDNMLIANVLWLQLAVCVMALLGGVASLNGRRAGVFSLLWSFLVMNGTAMMAWKDVLFGSLDARWKSTGSQSPRKG